MLRINFLLPYYELQDTVEAFIAEYEAPDVHFDMEHVVGVEDARKLRLDADIAVARGITCRALAASHPEIPVVEIPVNAYDILLAIDECRRSFGAGRIAVIGAENMVAGVPRVAGLLEPEVLCFPVRNEEHAQAEIARAVEMGAEAIVGGLMVYNLAQEARVPCTWIKTGPDALRQAIDEAVRTARVKARERERAEFFKIVMDYTHEAILAVDRQGRITALNRSACGILEISGEAALGTDIRRLIPDASLLDVMDAAEEELGVVRRVNDTLIAANLVPIRVGDEVTGVVATFQKVSRIQEVEGRIRRTIHTKGHVSKYRFADITCLSHAMATAVATARRYARIDANVLITGETGTGKELVAHSIHAASDRADHPFVAVNCAALPEALLESELFGYADGAFTGAARGGKAGLFEVAHGGTIFLDEIGEIPPPVQAKLLRVLQEREIMRVGDHRLIPVDVRVIAATNQDLRAADGRLRNDLLYRLDVLRISVPPLRQREEDILPLAAHFLRTFASRFGTDTPGIGDQGRHVLLSHPWPGNVRQLMNLCERLIAAGNSGAIGPQEVGAALDEPPSGEVGRAPPSAGTPSDRDLEAVEREAVMSALRSHGFQKSRAARALGMSRTTLWRKLRRWFPDS